MGKCIEKISAKMHEGKPFFSFEYFPPKTEDGVDNLFERMDRMVSYGPTFCDITWGAGGSTADLTLNIARRMQNEINIECMMHLTCTNMPESKLKEALAALKECGVKNILALRGDPPHGQDKFETVDGGFSCALDLIKYIRRETGDYFGIGVSGYPEAHPDAIVEDPEQMEKNYWADIQYLKEKLDAGADFVITQLFYDVDRFIKWVNDCRSVGISVPILPGIMPIMAFGGFNRMTSFCKTDVPKAVREKVDSLKDDEAGLKEYGIQLGVEMCQKILDANVSPGLHMYSLNQDKSTLAILERLGLLDQAKPLRALPFRARTAEPEEAVRPVYWQRRPKSYVSRTSGWGRFPKHSWSEARGQAFACAAQFMDMHVRTEKRREKALAAWGIPASLDDVKSVFMHFLQDGGPFPWAESTAVPKDLKPMAAQLQGMIGAGFLPIHALPAVNGAPSEDESVGWGPRSGRVYQRGLVEFFCSPDAFKTFVAKVQSQASQSYMAANSHGDFFSDADSTAAVAWGAFPGTEVKQPIVVCVDGFRAWAEEAFALWESMWGAIVEDSEAAKMLAEINNRWLLVSLLESDYISGDVFRVFAS